MKTLLPRFAAACLALAAAFPLRAAESASVLLQKAIYAEETEGNLDSAIKLYEQIAAEAATNRAIVAQAQYRLAVCFQKQGKKEQAIKVLDDLVQQPSLDSEVSNNAREALKQLGVVPPESVSIRKVPLPFAALWLMSVSSNGRYIAYWVDGTYDVAVCELSTGKTWTVYKGSKERQTWGDALLSPDGQWIAYDVQGAEIFISKLDGTETRKVYESGSKKDGDYAEPDGWTSDGAQLFIGLRSKTDSPVVVSVDLKTGTRKSITLPKVTKPDHWEFSPDGQYLARRQGSYPRMITLVELRTGHEETIVARDAQGVLGWAAGGTKLLFSKDRGAGIDLFSVGIKDGKPSGEPEQVWNNFKGGVMLGGVTSDNKIYYRTNPKGTAKDLWVMEGFLATNVASANTWTDIPPDELILGVDRSLVDRKFGLSATLPAGWKISDAHRTSDGGSIITGFGVAGAKDAKLGIRYRPTTPWVEGPPGSSGIGAHMWGPKKPAPGEVESWLRETAERLAQAAEQATKGFKRDSAGAALRLVDGRKAVTWSGSYMKNDVPWTDLVLHVYGGKAHGHIVLQTPTASLDAIRPAYESFVESFRLP